MDTLQPTRHEIHATLDQAVACLPGLHPDLALIDLDEGTVDALTLIEVLRQTCPQAVILVRASDPAGAGVQQALASGAHDLLTHEAQPAEWTARVRLARRRVEREVSAANGIPQGTPHPAGKQRIPIRVQRLIEAIPHLNRLNHLPSMARYLMNTLARALEAADGRLDRVYEDHLELLYALASEPATERVALPLAPTSLGGRVLAHGEPLVERCPATGRWSLCLLLTDDEQRPAALITLHAAAGREFTHQDLELSQVLMGFCCEALRMINCPGALRLERGCVHAMTHQTSDVVVLLSPEANISYASPSIENAIGRPSEALMGQALGDYLPEHEVARVRNWIANGHTTHEWVELHFRHADGQTRNFELLGTYPGGMDERQGLILHLREVAASRRSAHKLARLATAVENISDEIVITDPQGVIEYVNPAFSRVSGYSYAEVIGKKPNILKSGRHTPAFYEELWSTICSGQVWTGHLINRRKDGTHIEEEAAISPILGDDGELVGYVSVKRDITERLRLERHVRQMQKMEAIGTLAGGIAHDFNNLLQVICGFSELALATAKETPKLRNHLEQVVQAGRRARELVRQILLFSRQREEGRQVIALQTIAKEALKLLRGSLPSTIEIQQDICADCPPVQTDPTQFHQIIMNLATNAYHAIRERCGKLTVKLLPVVLEQAERRGDFDLAAGNYVELIVQDTGTGIAPENLDTIFEPYFTTKEEGEGTGLGLAIVQSIVMAHNGAIVVESTVGEGTTFHVLLPAQARENIDAPRQERETHKPRGTERLLVVDDEEAILELLRCSLSDLGYRVTGCTNSREALELVRTASEPYEMLITDMTMPELTGLELAEQAHAVQPNLPVLLCSGYSDRLMGDQSELKDIRCFLRKPITGSKLARAIREILDQPAADPS